jgi:hypothetical protein
MNLALLLNAEGMWVIATETLKLGSLFAALTFAVFEVAFLTSTSLAAERYRSAGDPGRMMWVALAIAVTSGGIVASGAEAGTEQALRIALPLIIFAMWWAALTADGVRARARGRFAYSPRRLAELSGLLIPEGDTDLDAMKAARQVRRMVTSQQRVAAGGPLAGYGRWRLSRDARTATDEVIAEVRGQLARIATVADMLTPSAPASEPIQVEAEIPAPVAEPEPAIEAPEPVRGAVRRAAGDLGKAIQLLMDGQDTKSVAGISGVAPATVRSYAALVRILWEDPHAQVPPSVAGRVKREVVDEVRTWARQGASR